MSIPAGNGATGAPGTGPALGYILNLFWFNSLFMLISENNMNTCTYLLHTLSFIYIMKLLVIFGIKIYQKLPNYLTPIKVANIIIASARSRHMYRGFWCTNEICMSSAFAIPMADQYILVSIEDGSGIHPNRHILANMSMYMI
jgi:hypothetical protein